MYRTKSGAHLETCPLPYPRFRDVHEIHGFIYADLYSKLNVLLRLAAGVQAHKLNHKQQLLSACCRSLGVSHVHEPLDRRKVSAVQTKGNFETLRQLTSLGRV